MPNAKTNYVRTWTHKKTKRKKKVEELRANNETASFEDVI